MIVKAAEIWIAQITFTNGVASKKRPVLVLWTEESDVVVAVVTSASPRTQTDVALKDWAIEGLRVPSTVRLARLDCLSQALLLKKIGKLSTTDAATILATWTLHVKPQF